MIVNEHSGCSLPIYLDGYCSLATFLPGGVYDNPECNQEASLNVRRLDPELLASIVISFDASGNPSATDASGKPYRTVEFPSNGSTGSTCAPAVVGANAPLHLGTGTAVAGGLPSLFYYLAVE